MPDISMASFKVWYMDLYWKFDNLFLVSAKFLGITYHEFVLISLCVVWPAITIAMLFMILRLWGSARTLRRQLLPYQSLEGSLVEPLLTPMLLVLLVSGSIRLVIDGDNRTVFGKNNGNAVRAINEPPVFAFSAKCGEMATAYPLFSTPAANKFRLVRVFENKFQRANHDPALLHAGAGMIGQLVVLEHGFLPPNNDDLHH